MSPLPAHSFGRDELPYGRGDLGREPFGGGLVVAADDVRGDAVGEGEVGELLDPLPERGRPSRLVERPLPRLLDDGRVRRLRIVATDKGQRALAEVCAQVTEAENATLAALDPRERELFRRLLVKAACDTEAVHRDGDACAIIEDALAK